MYTCNFRMVTDFTESSHVAMLRSPCCWHRTSLWHIGDNQEISVGTLPSLNSTLYLPFTSFSTDVPLSVRDLTQDTMLCLVAVSPHSLVWASSLDYPVLMALTLVTGTGQVCSSTLLNLGLSDTILLVKQRLQAWGKNNPPEVNFTHHLSESV